MTNRDLVFIALFAALTAALGVFPPFVIPLIGVPITAQSMGAMLAGSVLGARRGAAAMALFLALVLAGMPLLAGGRGGIAVFMGPGGGFLVGWIVSAFVIGWLCERFWHRLGFVYAALANLVGGILVLYPLGIAWIAFSMSLSPIEATASSLAFIPGDLIKVAIAAAVAVTVRRSYPLIERPGRA